MAEQFFTAALLGIVEGLAEFLPISSTGHLIILGDFLGFKGPPGKVFEIAIQLGAIAALLIAYWPRFWGLALGLCKRQSWAWHFACALVLATLPALLLGALFHPLIKTYLFTSYVVASMLILGGIIMLALERWPLKPATIANAENLSLKRAFGLGLIQCFSMIPGTSRAAATIIGGMALGLERRAAADFSFFLALPTLLAATCYDLYKNHKALAVDDFTLIAIGFCTALLAALLVVKPFIAYVSRHGFGLFAWYRILLGGGLWIWLLGH
jgi:undecaprenyl-diphosphatase